MFRLLAILAMLSPGIAHAQKFVSVDDGSDTTTASAQPTDGSAPAAESEEEVAEVDYDAYSGSVVSDGASVEEIEALLAAADANAQTADATNALVGRVGTDENGDPILTLDVAGSNGTQPTEDSGVLALELGECNEGTDWISDDTNCYNAYPSEF